MLRQRLAWILAFVSTQYVLIAVGSASATMWIANATSAVIAAKLDSIANALHRLH